VLQERNYVTVEKKRFFPNDLGRLVTAFLVGFFEKYVQYDFTADLETDLDKVAEGTIPWKNLMSNFWDGFNKNVEKVSEQKIGDVIAYVEKSLDFHLFGKEGTEEYKKNKKCGTCPDGDLSLKLGKYGAFLACSNYPDCTFKKQVSKGDSNEEAQTIIDNTKDLGQDKDGKTVYLKKGPYGWYVQAGEAESKKDKPKRSPLPATVKPDDLDLPMAIKLLSLPLHVGNHTETGEEIVMGIGKFGPYLKYQNKFTSIPRAIDHFAVTLEQAVELIAEKAKKDAAKKGAPKKVVAKKAVAKKVAPKKATPKKAGVKKVGAKVAKKAAPKKVAPKKAVAKKS